MSRYSQHKQIQDANEVRFMNEKEWRVLLYNKVENLDQKMNTINLEMSTLKVKVAGFSAIISSVATIIVTTLVKKL